MYDNDIDADVDAVVVPVVDDDDDDDDDDQKRLIHPIPNHPTSAPDPPSYRATRTERRNLSRPIFVQDVENGFDLQNMTAQRLNATGSCSGSVKVEFRNIRKQCRSVLKPSSHRLQGADIFTCI